MLRNTSVLLCLCLLAGCPRGEYTSVEQALRAAKGRYSAGASARVLSSLDPQVRVALGQIQAALEASAAGNAAGSQSAPFVTIEEGLRALIARAGYPSRPSLNALADQYQSLAENPPRLSEPFERHTLTLLAARTYDILSSELEAAKFSL